MFINIFDSHTHSDNSADGHHSVMFMCEVAAEKDISGICVTDHCEFRQFVEDKYDLRIAQSAFEVQKARRVFNGRVAVMLGIELSDMLYDPALTRSVLEKYPFDMVLASQHNLEDGTDAYYVDFTTWSKAEIDRYLEFYFTYLLRIAQEGDFDVMAHLTYPIRYITGVHKVGVDLSRFDDLIEQMLRAVAERGKAIEINTSGLRQELHETLPPFRYVTRFRELGGEYIVLGSDAHEADAIGKGIEVAMQMLIEAKFRYFSFYKDRQPLQFKII